MVVLHGFYPYPINLHGNQRFKHADGFAQTADMDRVGADEGYPNHLRPRGGYEDETPHERRVS